MSGGLSPAPDEDGEISPLTFLRRVYELGGGPYLDAVAHHPTSIPNRPTEPESSNAFLQTERLHELMASFGDGGEADLGYGGRRADSRRALGERAGPGRVGARVLRHLERLGLHRAAALVHGARQGRGNDIEDSFGLVRTNRTPKPALAAFEKMIKTSHVPSATRARAEPGALLAALARRCG